MTGQASKRRSNSTQNGPVVQARRPQRPAGNNTTLATANPATTVATPILPAISSTLVHQAPAELLMARQNRYFGNKVVLSIEAEFTKNEALEWVEGFNQ